MKSANPGDEWTPTGLDRNEERLTLPIMGASNPGTTTGCRDYNELQRSTYGDPLY